MCTATHMMAIRPFHAGNMVILYHIIYLFETTKFNLFDSFYLTQTTLKIEWTVYPECGILITQEVYEYDRQRKIRFALS